ncbi:MAG: GNAT family N-acetyltransferase, partial [Patescibacteria group bacterium]|nr:GNAT family N-acetyltransferase [Patescibacteria group bacterium]
TMDSMNRKNLVVSLAVPDDVPGMQDVFYYGWLATYPNKEYGITVDDIEDRYKDRHSEERLARRREQIATMSDNKLTMVAKLDGKIVGVCRMIKHPDKNQLSAIYVLPDYHGHGIGTAMWEAIQQHFDATKSTIVDVAVYNAKAIKFYEGLGFVDTGKRFSDPKFKMKSGAAIPEMEMIRPA